MIMEDNRFQEETNDPEELLKNYKAWKAIAWFFGGFILLLFIAVLIDIFKRGFNFLIFVPIVLIPLLVANIRMIKGLKKKLRDL